MELPSETEYSHLTVRPRKASMQLITNGSVFTFGNVINKGTDFAKTEVHISIQFFQIVNPSSHQKKITCLSAMIPQLNEYRDTGRALRLQMCTYRAVSAFFSMYLQAKLQSNISLNYFDIFNNTTYISVFVWDILLVLSPGFGPFFE